jgi:hypothetical protein
MTQEGLLACYNKENKKIFDGMDKNIQGVP